MIIIMIMVPKKLITAHVLLFVFALLVCVGHITVILVHFFGLVRNSNRTDSYVSDLLQHNKLYMNLMTFFVLLQLTACFGFVRLHAHWSTATRVAVESLFLSLSWTGWCVLIVFFEDSSSSSSSNGGNGGQQQQQQYSRLHFMGVGLFVGGGVVYFAFLMWELYVANTTTTTELERSGASEWVLVFLYITSAVLALLFIIGYFSGWESAWIFEHCAFVVFSMSHGYIFSLDVYSSSSSDSSCVEEERRETSDNNNNNNNNKGGGMFGHLRINPPNHYYYY